MLTINASILFASLKKHVITPTGTTHRQTNEAISHINYCLLIQQARIKVCLFRVTGRNANDVALDMDVYN